MRLSLFTTLACLAIGHAAKYKDIVDVWSFNLDVGKHADWMDTIADDTPLQSLSIPGTHHSMTTYLASSRMQTQNMYLEYQLQGGIRYIDITCRFWDFDIIVFHGFSRTFYTLESVLRMLFDFLDAHPREAIILRIRRGGVFDNSKTFFDSFEKKFTRDTPIGRCAAKYIYGINSDGITAAPTLGELRGKVLILQDFKTPTPGRYGLPWNSDTVSSYKSIIPLGTMTLASNWNGIKSHLSEEPSLDSHKLRITHTTASFGITPIHVAAMNSPNVGMNKLLGTYLREPDAKCFGIIVMDFPGEYLVETILGYNKKYQVPKPGSLPSDSTDTAIAEDGDYNT
ncbi:1-phosphatidylinositol phosphodiesterase [Ceratocystis lukuohia]|uniref:1-phosphatidylinositol phosphodiesterase n=1 Tax=Ceratocystis lukuohia TaxID=2019550 RepID=A0ABR4MAC6_9PEZI